MGSKRELKDEFERITQFLAVVSNEMAFNEFMTKIFYAALSNIVSIIKL
jgi:hypothetical protein